MSSAQHEHIAAQQPIAHSCEQQWHGYCSSRYWHQPVTNAASRRSSTGLPGGGGGPQRPQNFCQVDEPCHGQIEEENRKFCFQNQLWLRLLCIACEAS